MARPQAAGSRPVPEPHRRFVINALAALLRPHQWVKNGFVLVGLLFAPVLDVAQASRSAVAVMIFCLAASSAYVVNDIRDAASDRMHPTKCRRPIASGAITVRTGWIIAAALAAPALALAAWLGPEAVAFAACYLLINAAYSLGLKHVVILDVFIIAAGFMLRILIGTEGIGIPPSQWLLLTGLMLTLFLGFAKRRSELLLLEAAGTLDRAAIRRVLDDYSPVVLDQLTGVTAAGAILCYSLYTISPVTRLVHGSNNLVYTVPLVMYGIFRYLFLLHHHARGGDTARDLFADRHLLATVAAWFAVVATVLH